MADRIKDLAISPDQPPSISSSSLRPDRFMRLRPRIAALIWLDQGFVRDRQFRMVFRAANKRQHFRLGHKIFGPEPNAGRDSEVVCRVIGYVSESRISAEISSGRRIVRIYAGGSR